MVYQTKIEALRELVLSVFRINGALLVNSNERVKPSGLTGAQYQVLGAIGLHDTPVTVPQIAKFIGITRQGVQKQIKMLLDKEVIECIANPYHERSPLYGLTEKGKELYDVICLSHQKIMEQLSGSFVQNELDITLKVMKQFYSHLVTENIQLAGCCFECDEE